MANFNKFLVAIFVMGSLAASAQDIHFSQFNAAPLQLNPALTGNYACDWRAGANYRNQWGSIPAKYETFSVFADAPVIKGIRGTDNLAVGIYIYNDVSGDGNLSNLSVLASTAYHMQLGTNQYLSGGLQVGFSQKKLDWANLQFGNQFDGTSFNTAIPNFEPYQGDNINNIDLNFGLVYKGRFSESFAMEVGAAANHLTSPTETFLDDQGNSLGTRMILHGKFTVNLDKNLALIPGVMYQDQSGATEMLFGAEIGYFMRNPNFPATIYAGAYLRNGDALIPMVAIDYKNFKFGFSYDVNTSGLDVATNGSGGFEVSLVYTGCILPVLPENYILPCPRY